QCGDKDSEVAEMVIARGACQISRPKRRVVVSDGVDLLNSTAYLALGDDTQQSCPSKCAQVIVERGLRDIREQLTQLPCGELTANQCYNQAHTHRMQDEIGARGCHLPSPSIWSILRY